MSAFGGGSGFGGFGSTNNQSNFGGGGSGFGATSNTGESATSHFSGQLCGANTNDGPALVGQLLDKHLTNDFLRAQDLASRTTLVSAARRTQAETPLEVCKSHAPLCAFL